MTRPAPRVVVLDDYEGFLARSPVLSALDGRIELVPYDRPLREADLEAALRDVPIVIALRERTPFPADVLARMPDVELLLQTGGHAYHIDRDAATSSGIAVALGRASIRPSPVIAELVVGLMIAWYRGIVPAVQGMRSGAWPAQPGRLLRGRTLGILGLGRHGITVARAAKALGMRIVAWGPSLTVERAAAEEVELLSLPRLLTQADIVSVHLRLSPESTGLIGARELELMGPNTFLINTSRGAIVDEDALLAALRDRRIEGAALDVFTHEPLPPDHPFRFLDNVICTPHIGYTVDAAFDDFARTSVSQLDAYLRGELDPELLINPEVLDRHSATRGGFLGGRTAPAPPPTGQ